MSADPQPGDPGGPGGPGDLAALAEGAGIRRINMLAWRDLADPEAGGSELHSSTVAGIWARAGIEVTLRTSHAEGAPAEEVRDGYRVIRKGGRISVYPRAVLAELARRHGPRDALVEIWTGVPFLTPLWARGPRAAWLHHLQTDVWPLVLGPRMARLGHVIEHRLAPPLYRRTPVVTLSQSARSHLLERVRLRPGNVFVVPPGVDAAFTPGDSRAAAPTVLAVGRLMPTKAFDVLIAAVAELQATLPGTRLVIVGEGPERGRLERLAGDLGAAEHVELAGRVSTAELVEHYRSAWVLASASRTEGWGMTITEAAACATPAVASRIPGHVDAIDEGVSGLLVDSDDDYAGALASLLADQAARERLGAAAAQRAAGLRWERTAYDLLAILAAGPRAAVGQAPPAPDPARR